MRNGAFDYLIKPLRKNELIVKLEIIFERLKHQKHHALYFENLMVPPEITFQNLTKKEFILFNIFW